MDISTLRELKRELLSELKEVVMNPRKEFEQALGKIASSLDFGPYSIDLVRDYLPKEAIKHWLERMPLASRMAILRKYNVSRAVQDVIVSNWKEWRLKTASDSCIEFEQVIAKAEAMPIDAAPFSGGAKLEVDKGASMNPRKAFEHTLLVNQVTGRYAMEFPTEEAREKYLKDHPGADKSLHTVKKTEAPSESKEKEEPKDKEEAPELSKKKQLTADRAYQKSEAYKTEKKEGYYPQKAPEGMKYPEELDVLPGDLKEHVMSMVEEDLDKEESYSHPKLNKLKKAIIKRLRTVGQRLEVEKEFQQLETLSGELSKKRRHAKSDAEADPYRFAVRKVYHAWQAYNIAFQEWHRSDKEATMNPRKELEHAILVNRVASRFAMEFPTEDARKKYLKDHPGADPSKHTVKKDKEKERLDKEKELKTFLDFEQTLEKLKRKKSALEMLSNPRIAFEQLLGKIAMEFPTEEARAKYLKDHPGADKAKHTIKKDEGPKTLSDVAKEKQRLDKEEGGKHVLTEKGWSVKEKEYEGLPKDLSKLTDAQHTKVINTLSKKPLKELRKRQDLVNKQLETAHKQRNDEGMKNLQVMQKHLDSAVDKKEFGE
jgi:hypothetical protein